MQPYGTNNCETLRYPDPNGPDTHEIQSAVLPGYRIRNRKQKNRLFKKRTRHILKKELRTQTDTAVREINFENL